jgi:hypothetical protein
MTAKARYPRLLAVLVLAAAEALPGALGLPGALVAPAQAVIGNPVSPGSVAGVARRTTRRIVRRSTIYVATLPRGCVVHRVNGVTYWRCGATYYEPVGTRFVVVYID